MQVMHAKLAPLLGAPETAICSSIMASIFVSSAIMYNEFELLVQTVLTGLLLVQELHKTFARGGDSDRYGVIHGARLNQEILCQRARVG